MSKRRTKSVPYESAVLQVLNGGTGPFWDEEIYRRFEIYKMGEGNVLFDAKKRDPEHEKSEVRWALSEMSKPERGLVKNRARGLWEITEAGRAHLSR